MHRRSVTFALNVLFATFCILWNTPGTNLKCVGDEFPLDILPEGDHVIEYGSTLVLYCKLNLSHPDAKGFHARDLHFIRLADLEKVILPNQTVINDTTIRLDLVAPHLGSNFYFCILNDFKCLTNVVVGYKPQPVSDFECVSYNWENLRCHWTPPKNDISTEYRLYYELNLRPGIFFPCPNELDVKNNSCYYDYETDPPFRQTHKNYNFMLIGENDLGNITMNFTFYHYAHVLPNKPENVTIVSKAIGSAVVGWFIPYPIFNLPQGLRVKIEYKNKWEDWTDAKVPQDLSYQNKSHTYNITGLKYSHTAYDVRIYLKSFEAPIGPNFWSEPASVTFVTPSTVPSQPPLTTEGGFEVVSNGNDTDVYIYWARVSEKFENGDNFSYNVICSDDNGKECGAPIEKAASYAKFPFNFRKSYKFTVYSENEVGNSVNSSFVFVKYKRYIQPQSVTKVAYDHGVFELSWRPVSHPELSNYTVFWCKEEKDLPVPCKGYLDWVTVPKDSTTKNVTVRDVSKFYKFAIAANLVDGTSSGMVWSSCVIFHDKVLKTVDDFHISRVGSREVDVIWEIRCAQSSAFRGFAFYYCPVDFSSQDNKCKGDKSEELTKLNVSDGRNITLTNLKPYTTYKLQISIISLDGSRQIQLGPRSISKWFSTLEDAPSVPLNLSATFVSNTSVTLQWILPQEMNGVLESYKLNIERQGFGREISFRAQNLSDGRILNKYEIKNLISYTNYNFTLKACTSNEKCSEYSKPAITSTLIGSPGKMMRPQISIVNSSVADVSWDLPIQPGGPLDYYQLLITLEGGSGDYEIYNLTGSRVKLAIKSCQVKYNTPEFRIRAINVDKNNVTYFGPWSDSTEVHCGSSVWAENSVLIDWLSGTFTIIIVLSCLFCIFKRGWLQCTRMKDVDVALPSGLESQDLQKESPDYVHLERWPPRSTETVTGSVGTVLAPDEESLLDKKSDENMDITSFNLPIKNGGDSSGCSVGRESVSSSITSDTHISSDSGAEPDQCMIKPSAFEMWNSSNQGRKIPNQGRNNVANFPNLGEWDLNEPPLPGYTKVGFGPNGLIQDKNLPSKGYVTIASVPTLNPSQKTNKSLSEENYTNCSENSFPTTNSTTNSKQSSGSSGSTGSSGSKYVSLARFEGQGLGESNKTSFNGGRLTPRELPKLSRLDESSERDDERTEDSTEDDFSGKETDAETIHEVPAARNIVPSMPPYVTMTETPLRAPFEPKVVDADEKEDDVDDVQGASDPEDATDLEEDTLAPGTENVAAEKVIREPESFSNYIPHHSFGKESVNT